MKGKFTGVHHVAFATNDLEKTVRFWRDLLGMRLVYTMGDAGNRQYFFEVSETTLISFFEWFDAEGVPYRRHGEPVKGPHVFDHISIGMEDVEAIMALGNRLAAADFPVSNVVNHGCFLSIYSYDPNHIPIEFSCNSPGNKVRSKPIVGDNPPLPVALEGPEPQWDKWPEPEPMEEEDKIIVDGDGMEFCQDLSNGGNS
ncbi:MAG: VOC family protein [Magnetococcales bacterium]|nr:VOC family protein [Magnetococcales bacterium]